MNSFIYTFKEVIETVKQTSKENIERVMKGLKENISNLPKEFYKKIIVNRTVNGVVNEAVNGVVNGVVNRTVYYPIVVFHFHNVFKDQLTVIP